MYDFKQNAINVGYVGKGFPVPLVHIRDILGFSLYTS